MSCCNHGYERNTSEICIQPYHYNRIEAPGTHVLKHLSATASNAVFVVFLEAAQLCRATRLYILKCIYTLNNSKTNYIRLYYLYGKLFTNFNKYMQK